MRFLKPKLGLCPLLRYERKDRLMRGSISFIHDLKVCIVPYCSAVEKS